MLTAKLSRYTKEEVQALQNAVKVARGYLMERCITCCEICSNCKFYNACADLSVLRTFLDNEVKNDYPHIHKPKGGKKK